jgi:hypothetical protein
MHKICFILNKIILGVLSWQTSDAAQTIAITLAYAGYWTASICYISLSSLALIAQIRPFLHHKLRTIRFCVYLSLISWPIAIVYAIFGNIKKCLNQIDNFLGRLLPILVFLDVDYSCEQALNHPLRYISAVQYLTIFLCVIGISIAVKCVSRNTAQHRQNSLR